MLAVFVFMVAFFMLMGVVTALADAWMGVGRRSGRRRRPGRYRSRRPGMRPVSRPPAPPAVGPTVFRRRTPVPVDEGDGALLLAEIEEWLKQQQ